MSFFYVVSTVLISFQVVANFFRGGWNIFLRVANKINQPTKTAFSMQPMKMSVQAIQKGHLSCMGDVLGQNFDLNCS